MCRGPRDCVEEEKRRRWRATRTQGGSRRPNGHFTAAAAEAGDGEEPEGAAGDACANIGGTGGAEEEAETAAGDACANVGGTGGAEEAETAAGDVCANVGGTGGAEEAAEKAASWRPAAGLLAGARTFNCHPRCPQARRPQGLLPPPLNWRWQSS